MVMDEGEIGKILKKVDIRIEASDLVPPAKKEEFHKAITGKGKGKGKLKSPSKAIVGKKNRPSLNQCCNDPTAKAIDKLLKNVINKVALQHRKKLTNTDMTNCKLGGSLIYSVMYYAPDAIKNLDHPLIVMATAMGGLGIIVMDYQNTAIPGSK